MEKERLGVLIAENRRKQGLTQRELADRLQVTDKAVSKWERGLSYPDITLLEPLAECLGLRVEELIAEKHEEENPASAAKQLLPFFRETLRWEQRKFRRRLGLMAGALLFTILAVLYGMSYSGRSDWKTAIVLKEQLNGMNYLYVQEAGQLLRLRCADSVAYDQIVVDQTKVYVLDCRWNRWTGKGTVTSCTESHLKILGDASSLIGSGMGFDPGENDTLFGYPKAIYLYEYAAQDPYHMPEILYSISVLVGESQETLKKVLTVEQCYTFCQVDYDGDGVTELAVRTRWAEKPYTLYDMAEGEITANWPEEVTPELAEQLMTEHERQLWLQKELDHVQ